MKMLNREELKAYKERWKIVAEIEEAERRQTTLSQRWQKLNNLFRFAAGLGMLSSSSEQPEEIVSQQWLQHTKI